MGYMQPQATEIATAGNPGPSEHHARLSRPTFGPRVIPTGLVVGIELGESSGLVLYGFLLETAPYGQGFSARK